MVVTSGFLEQPEIDRKRTRDLRKTDLKIYPTSTIYGSPILVLENN